MTSCISVRLQVAGFCKDGAELKTLYQWNIAWFGDHMSTRQQNFSCNRVRSSLGLNSARHLSRSPPVLGAARFPTALGGSIPVSRIPVSIPRTQSSVAATSSTTSMSHSLACVAPKRYEMLRMLLSDRHTCRNYPEEDPSTSQGLYYSRRT